jgi:hypothetical protein
MPAAIPDEIRNRVIKQWLSGDTRAKIASVNKIGEGSVTNIVSDFNKGLADSEFEPLMEIAAESRKQGLTLGDLGDRLRLYDYIKKLGVDGDQIESFFVNCMNGANSLPPEKIIDLTNQLFEVAKSESIPLVEVPVCIKQKFDDKQKLEEKIKEADATLQSKNVDIETINEYNQLKAGLSKHNLSLEDPTRLLSILQTIKQIGYEPQKIVARFSYIESLRQTEKALKNNCKMLEKRAARYQHILPVSEQFVSFGIGIDPLIAFDILVTETAETYNILISTAAFRVIKEIEDYRKIIGLKRELSRLAVQIYSMNEILGRKNNAVMALLKLQSHGVTEDQILSMYSFFEKNGGMQSDFKRVQHAPNIFTLPSTV